MSSRSKAGCITCRIRRVKCDETKPHCLKCQSSKRVCDGYLSDDNSMSRRELAETVRNLHVPGPVSRALSQSPSSANPLSRPVSPHDTTFFDLFRRATAPGTSSIFPSSFWQRDLMQMAHSEPAIWHATVALGTLHQRWEAISQNQDDTALEQRAVTHYGKAMALAKDLDSPEKVVTLSLALVASANMLERWAEMQTHVLAGLRIIAHDNGRSPVLQQLETTLRKVDVLAMTFSDSSSPYPYDEVASVSNVDAFLANLPTSIQSYEEAAAELFGFWRSHFLLDESNLAGQIKQGPWLTKGEIFMRGVINWETNMANFERGQRADAAQQTTRVAIRLYHAILRAMLRVSPFGSEQRYDAILGYYEYIIRLAATLHDRLRGGLAASLTLEPGLIAPLWLVIQRCRHPALRHAGLTLLRESNRQEGMWRSDITARILEKVVDVEEQCFSAPYTGVYQLVPLDPAALNTPWHLWSRPNFDLPTTVSWENVPVVPEEQRIKDILGLTSFESRKVELQLMMCSDDKDKPYGPIRDVTVTF